MQHLRPFHLEIPVSDIEVGRQFYGGIFGCADGRSAETWVDFDFYGHQLVIHYDPTKTSKQNKKHHNPVDGDDVPVPHFGIVLGWEHWEDLAGKLSDNGVEFVIEPHVRFKGQVGEQATMFF